MSNPFRAAKVDGPSAKRGIADLWDRVTEQIAGTSTTSLTIGTGAKTLNVGPDKQFATGQTVRIADATDPVGLWMQATVTGYDAVTGALDVTVTDVSGSGAHADWSVALSGGTGPQGEPGDPGDDGREVLLQANATHIQWRYAEAPGWTDLVALETLRGPAGRAVQMQVSATHIQWRLAGDVSWINLVALGDLQGAPGDPGEPGANGWAPVLATVADGARYVHRVVDWVGGTGSKPATGSYVGATGLVPNIADGVDIRGAAGAGSGDVSGPAGATDGHMAVFDGATGKLVKGGGAPLALGTTAETAKAGNYAPTATEIAVAAFGAAAKATPVDADTLLITDSATSNGPKKLTWANLKATLKTYTDTLYRAAAWVPAWGDVTGKPTFGTASAQDSAAFATATQGTKADAALPATSGTTKGVSATYLDKGTVASGTATLSFVDGEHQRVQAGGDITIALSNVPASGKLMELLVEAVNFGGRTITWPTVNWVKSDGTTTTTTSANGVTWQASGTDFVLLWTRDGGTTIYGKVMR